MVQQKVVMKVQMSSEKCRTKALKIAAVAKADGTLLTEQSVYRTGERSGGSDRKRDRLHESMTLTMTMRKKVGHADIVSVEEVKAEEDTKEIPITCTSSYAHYPRYPPHYHVVVREEPTICPIM